MQYFGFDRPSFGIKTFGFGDSFSPLELFVGGKQGVWYDPSDKSTLFQDIAGTVPVTKDGDPVALMRDKSGNNNHAVQAVSTARPVYKTDGILHWLESDGVDDYIFSSDFGLAQPTTVALGVSLLTAKVAYLFNGLKFNSCYVLLNSLGQNRTLSGSIGTTDFFDPKIPVGQKFVTSVVFNAEKSEIAFNGEAARLFNTGSTAMQGISLFSRIAESAYNTHGRIYGVVVLNGLADPLKKNQIAQYLANKAGVTL